MLTEMHLCGRRVWRVGFRWWTGARVLRDADFTTKNDCNLLNSEPIFMKFVML